MPNQNRLRDARERAGLSQAALAARAGISRQAVGAVEGGRHAPSVDTALRLVRAVGATVEEVFGEAPSPVPAGGLADGTSVAVARVGDRAVAHPLAGLVAGDTAWATPDGGHGGEDDEQGLEHGGRLRRERCARHIGGRWPGLTDAPHRRLRSRK